MADTESKKPNISVAKRHQVLEDITTQIKGVEISDSITVAGHKYLLRTLNSDEEVWADGYISSSSAMAAVTSMKLPTLAAAIRAIDGIKSEDMFEFSENMKENDKAYHGQSTWHLHYWQMSQMLLWLGGQDNSLIIELWKFYIGLTERRDTSWEELKKSCARIPGGDSKVTSSPERESSRAIQM
jgi:hypothetical protein